jgi:predicted nucleic acid-binding protein
VNVLVDTSIWSLAFRKPSGTISPHEKAFVSTLAKLIDELRAVLIGPIRQEILSGIADEKQFASLQEKLSAFDDLPITMQDYESAAAFYNICRKAGIQGSHIDFLICAVASRNELLIFTRDRDFDTYSKFLDIELYSPPQETRRHQSR